ncbi:hypothetical protein [Klebsiella aerogenes]|uniref:hypothetical protein n=1 Tax=Klebsiella aerogenes TaxID=548 RepID=UPI0006664A0D|nr:hypothetical protein [Klebsiella aerogenes]
MKNITKAPVPRQGTVGFPEDIAILLKLLNANEGPTPEESPWTREVWQMVNALVYALCYQWLQDKTPLSRQTINETLPLDRMMALYQEALSQKWRKEGYQPLEKYLSGLPGFGEACHTGRWPEEAYNQHGYLVQQYRELPA